MDARELATRVTCVEGRLTLTATITRSADYAGAIEKNVLWHPRILLSAIFHQASAEVESVWRLRLTTGQELSSGQTPPYQGAPYPRSLRRSFSRPLAPAKQTP
jgi:hypothetical protein